MSLNAEYLARMEAQLKKWDAELDALTAYVEEANADARAAYQRRLKEIRASREAAQRSFQELRLASESAGEQMQAGMKVAWETMQKALEKVSADLRK